MAFNENLKQARTDNGLTQMELGGLIGVAKSTVAGYEKGNSEPDVLKILKIMDALNVDANFLFGKAEIVRATIYTTEEQQLVSDYRELNNQGKEYVQQSMELAVGKYKKHDIDRMVSGEKNKLNE